MNEINHQLSDDNSKSIHSSHINDIYEVPMDVIIRPIPPVLDEAKVKSLMETIGVSVGNN